MSLRSTKIHLRSAVSNQPTQVSIQLTSAVPAESLHSNRSKAQSFIYFCSHEARHPLRIGANRLVYGILHKEYKAVVDSLFYSWFKSPQKCDVIALAASAGGFEAFAQILSELPSDFTVPIIALLHRGIRQLGRDGLVDFLSRRSQLPVFQAKPGTKLEMGTIHVIPPVYDMRLYAGRFLLHFPASRIRPSADVLFESMAEEYGPRCIGVVLSGAMKDGARGVAAIKGVTGPSWCRRRKLLFRPGCPGQLSGRASQMGSCIPPISRIRWSASHWEGGASRMRHVAYINAIQRHPRQFSSPQHFPGIS